MSVEIAVNQVVRPNAKTVSTTCAYCGVGCGVDIGITPNTKGLVVDKLNGCQSHPANFGRLCVKGSNLLNTLDNNQKLTQASIDSTLVSTEEATDYVASQFQKIIKEHGPDAVAFYVSGQLLTEDYYVANKLMKGYIGSGNIDTNSRLCMSSAVAAYKRAFGEDIVPCSYQDIEHCDLLIITGSNMAWTHPVLFQRLERAREINPELKVVCLDPRKTATSELADIHLPITPSSDGGFFNGLLRYLVETDSLDESFIEQHTNHFIEAAKAVKPWTVKEVSTFCGVPESTLEQVYQLFATSDKVVTFYSMGINQSNTGVDKCNSIINCHLATGKIGKLGAGPFSITGQPNAMGGREVGGLANQLASHLDIDNPQHQRLVQEFWQSPTIATKAGLNATDLFKVMKTGKIKAVWIMATNPVVSLPDHQQIQQALSQCPLVVVSDCAANTDTLSYANVKLPATGWFEKNGTVTNSERRISRQRGIVKPNGDAKHDWQLICDVAKKMGFDGFDYQHPSEIFAEFAALSGIANQSERKFDISGLANITTEQYDALQPIQWPINDKYPNGCQNILSDLCFSTPTRKANFIPITPKLAELPKQDQSVYLLNSGRIRDQWHTMTRTGATHKLFTTQDQPYVSVSLTDAKLNRLKNDQIIELTNKFGQVHLPVKIDVNQKVGELFVPIHWNRQFASNANIASLYPTIIDPVSGQPQLKQTQVNIEKLNFEKYVQVYARTSVNTPVDYWHKVQGNGFVGYKAACFEDDNRQIDVLKQAIVGIWYSFKSDDKEIFLCTLNDKLTCYYVKTSQSQPLNMAWLDHMFSLEKVDFSDIQSLLIGQPSDEFLQGKTVCSCFNVREKTIVDAINKGCNSVNQLSEKLSCGTKCGSCKPELEQYVNRFSSREQPNESLLDVVELT